MKCPICDIEMQIFAARTVCEGDDNPQDKTQVFIEQDLKCINSQCANFSKIVAAQRARLL